MFPSRIRIRAKNDMQKGQVVYSRDIADITSVEFQDGSYEIIIKDGDRLVWLFGDGPQFGLYFDFTGKLLSSTIPLELGCVQRRLSYQVYFDFLENRQNFDSLLKDGWFPFIQLVGETFEKLIEYYTEDRKYESFINDILDRYTEEHLNSIVTSWWNNPIFLSKQRIIEAGISAYLQDNDSGYINCIKTLLPEVEGIMRIACFEEKNLKNPQTKDIKNYIIEKGRNVFQDEETLGFPKLFADYLNEVIFKGFNISTGDIPMSRHSVAHGLAGVESYSKARALQMILLLDQIYFYLG